MSIHIHIDRLVLDNLDTPAGYPVRFKAEFLTALCDHIRIGAHRAEQPTIGRDPVTSGRSAAATAAHAIQSRIAATAAGDTPRAERPRR